MAERIFVNTLEIGAEVTIRSVASSHLQGELINAAQLALLRAIATLRFAKCLFVNGPNGELFA